METMNDIEMPYEEIYTAKTAEEWINVEGTGTYWDDIEGGEMWYFAGWPLENGRYQPKGMWRLCISELDPKEIRLLFEYSNEDERYIPYLNEYEE